MKTDGEATELTLMEIARVVAGEPPKRTAAKVGRIVATDARFAPQVEELDTLVEEAGLDSDSPTRFWDALTLHGKFDTLLAAGDSADTPEAIAKVLEDTEWILDVDHLCRIAEARAARAEEPAPLLSLRQRLERARAEVEARVKLVGDFLEGLAKCPRKVARTLLDKVEQWRSREAHIPQGEIREWLRGTLIG